MQQKTAQTPPPTHSWNERKRRFSADQIALARDVLARKGWLTA